MKTNSSHLRITPADLVVLAGALRLFRVAASLRKRPITAVLPAMDRQWPAVRTEHIGRAVRASQRAGPRARRWFGTLDTCLTRSMVAAILLESRSQARLVIGFRPGDAMTPADGHAWLAIADQAFQLTTPSDLETRPYSCLAEIPLEPRPDLAAPKKNTARGRLADGTGVMLDLDAGTVSKTNETATVLLEAIERGVTGVAPLAAALTDRFDVDAPTATKDVEAFLAELASR